MRTQILHEQCAKWKKNLWCNNLFNQECMSLFAYAVDLFVSSSGSRLAKTASWKNNQTLHWTLPLSVAPVGCWLRFVVCSAIRTCAEIVWINTISERIWAITQSWELEIFRSAMIMEKTEVMSVVTATVSSALRVWLTNVINTHAWRLGKLSDATSQLQKRNEAKMSLWIC